MTDAEGFSVRVKRKVLRSVDKERSLEKCFEKAPLIVEVVNVEAVGVNFVLHYT